MPLPKKQTRKRHTIDTDLYVSPHLSAHSVRIRTHLFRFSREQRRQTLSAILEYYSLHYTSLSSLNSLDVLRRLFD